MPGNEKQIVKFLLDTKGSLTLPHLGRIVSIKNPITNGESTEVSDVDEMKSDDARKKADIIVNGYGVSIKQSGSSYLYNRLQRADLHNLFKVLEFRDPEATIQLLDSLVNKKNSGEISNRDRLWSEVFEFDEFKKLLEFLMMQGSPNYGRSRHPATLIMTAPRSGIASTNIEVYSFNEFVSKFSDSIFLTIRPQWIGQSSKSEHGRALSISKKPGNSKWVFSRITGTPSTGWRPASDFDVSDRREVYMIYIQLIL